MSNLIHIGILGAMPEEVTSVIKLIEVSNEEQYGDLRICSGFLKTQKKKKDIFLSIAWSGWGKVSSARAATRLISLNLQSVPRISLIIFNGVAGAADSNLKQWDIVIASQLVQHDLDARPIFKKYTIPALKTSKLNTNKNLLEWATKKIKSGLEETINLPFGNVYNGIIATGDQFISDKKTLEILKNDISNLSAVEMEGASVAQVAIQENIDWLVIRVISDDASAEAAQKFENFLIGYNKFSSQLINMLLQEWDEDTFEKF